MRRHTEGRLDLREYVHDDETLINYVNEVESRSPLVPLLGGMLIGRIALKYWGRAVIRTMRQMLSK